MASLGFRASPGGVTIVTGATFTATLPAGRTAADFATTGRVRFRGTAYAIVPTFGSGTVSFPWPVGPASIPPSEACFIDLDLPSDAALLTLPVSVVKITANTTLSFAAHNDRILQVDSASDVTLTLPANGPLGFAFLVDQVGAGKAIFAVAGAATKVNVSSYDRTSGAGAQMGGYVRSNVAGNNAVYVLSGAGATS